MLTDIRPGRLTRLYWIAFYFANYTSEYYFRANDCFKKIKFSVAIVVKCKNYYLLTREIYQLKAFLSEAISRDCLHPPSCPDTSKLQPGKITCQDPHAHAPSSRALAQISD